MTTDHHPSPNSAPARLHPGICIMRVLTPTVERSRPNDFAVLLRT